MLHHAMLLLAAAAAPPAAAYVYQARRPLAVAVRPWKWTRLCSTRSPLPVWRAAGTSMLPRSARLHPRALGEHCDCNHLPHRRGSMTRRASVTQPPHLRQSRYQHSRLRCDLCHRYCWLAAWRRPQPRGCCRCGRRSLGRSSPPAACHAAGLQLPHAAPAPPTSTARYHLSCWQNPGGARCPPVLLLVLAPATLLAAAAAATTRTLGGSPHGWCMPARSRRACVRTMPAPSRERGRWPGTRCRVCPSLGGETWQWPCTLRRWLRRSWWSSSGRKSLVHKLVVRLAVRQCMHRPGAADAGAAVCAPVCRGGAQAGNSGREVEACTQPPKSHAKSGRARVSPCRRQARPRQCVFPVSSAFFLS
jgi:hypothetical protein